MTTDIPKTGEVPKTGDGSSVPSVASSSTAVPVAALLPVNHSEKPEKFNGTEFRRWQQKMLFYLTTLRLARNGQKKLLGFWVEEKIFSAEGAPAPWCRVCISRLEGVFW